MTEALNLTANIQDADGMYQLIVDMHQDLTEEESLSANAKLILLLANHIGDPVVIAEATSIARGDTLAWREPSKLPKH